MRLVLSLLALAAVACTDPPDNGDFGLPPDLKPPRSACGAPGDVGNQFGVGMFCNENKECIDNLRAQTCTALKNEPSLPMSNDSYFCTFICMADAGTNQCGVGAHCVCSPLSCSCLPRTCTVPDAGFHF